MGNAILRFATSLPFVLSLGIIFYYEYYIGRDVDFILWFLIAESFFALAVIWFDQMSAEDYEMSGWVVKYYATRTLMTLIVLLPTAWAFTDHFFHRDEMQIVSFVAYCIAYGLSIALPWLFHIQRSTPSRNYYCPNCSRCAIHSVESVDAYSQGDRESRHLMECQKCHIHFFGIYLDEYDRPDIVHWGMLISKEDAGVAQKILIHRNGLDAERNWEENFEKYANRHGIKLGPRMWMSSKSTMSFKARFFDRTEWWKKEYKAFIEGRYPVKRDNA